MRKEIDGAEVLTYTQNKDFGFVEFENREKKLITVLAICRYDQKEECYLFACDDQVNVLGDTLHYTMEEAMDFAKEYYGQEEMEWQDL